MGQPNGAAPGGRLSISDAYQLDRAIAARSRDDARRLLELGIPTVHECSGGVGREQTSVGRIRAIWSRYVEAARVDTFQLEPIAGKARSIARCQHVVTIPRSAAPSPRVPLRRGDIVVVGTVDGTVKRVLVADDVANALAWDRRIRSLGWPRVIDMTGFH